MFHKQAIEQQSGHSETMVPDPEVMPKAKRRQFTAKYKLAILAEVDRCTEPGQVGADPTRRVFVKRKRTHLTVENGPTLGYWPKLC